MKDSSLPARTTYDTTPATHGDLDIWGGRLIEIIDEAKKELKEDVQELRTEFNKRMDASDARQSQMQDTLTDTLLLVKSIDKKLSKK